MIDLEAYTRRIGYVGRLSPTLGTLHALCEAHVRSIPFEGLDVLLDRGIDLDPARIEQKLVHERRGGYCFEHNTLFLHVLEAIGFTVRPIGARVRLERTRDVTPPRTHMFLRVAIDGETWLADVGVGGLSPTAALRLGTSEEQSTPHEPRRIVQEADGRWFHQAKLGSEWLDVCEFTLDEMPLIDRTVANWYTSTHPQTRFRERLMVARATEAGGRVSILNRELTVRRADGTAEKRTLGSPAELLRALAEHFGLHFPEGTEFPCPALDWHAGG